MFTVIIFRGKSNIVVCEISRNLKIGQMRWLVDKCKNSVTKITALRAEFLHKELTFFFLKGNYLISYKYINGWKSTAALASLAQRLFCVLSGIRAGQVLKSMADFGWVNYIIDTCVPLCLALDLAVQFKL